VKDDDGDDDDDDRGRWILNKLALCCAQPFYTWRRKVEQEDEEWNQWEG